MTGFFNALSASLVLLMLMSVGYFMGVLGWMTAQDKKFVSKYIVNIAVPCNCVVGLLNNLSHDQLAQAGIMLVSGLLGVGATLLLSMALATLLRLPRERWGVFVLMAGLSNTIFIGIPVSTQLFGEACMPYLMIYFLANTTFLQSLGFVLIERAGSKGGGGGNAYSVNDTGEGVTLNAASAIDGSGRRSALSGNVYVITASGTSQLEQRTTASNTGSFVISGSGYGHHVGMSQWGAYSMADLGYSYRDILQFYYTDTTIR